MRLIIDKLWNGEDARPDEQVSVLLRPEPDGLRVSVDAPWHGDPAPPGPPGSTPGLWNYEAVEVFLLGGPASPTPRYLEVEFGPFGHYLVLKLEGIRCPTAVGLALPYHARREGRRFLGEALIPLDYLPPGDLSVNAYALHGTGASRRYLAAIPTGGTAPDFHRPERFVAAEFEMPTR